MNTQGNASVLAGARLEVDGAVAHLIIDRPDHRNAIDLDMARSLQAALEECASNTTVRALLIRAEGDHFGVGGDLAFVGGGTAPVPEIIGEMVARVQDAVARVSELEIPVVAAAGGAVAGASLGLLWASDIVIAADDLRVITAFAAVGLSGDGGSSWWLPRLVGLRRAQELLLENRRLTAEEAYEWGLVTRVVPAAQLNEEAERTAHALAAGPTVALGRIRTLLRDGAGLTLREHLAREDKGVRMCARSEDMPAAVRAFNEKRTPRFEGR